MYNTQQNIINNLTRREGDKGLPVSPGFVRHGDQRQVGHVGEGPDAITREVSYGNSLDSISTIMADSVGDNRNNQDGKTYQDRWRIGRLGRWQSPSFNNNDEKTYAN